MKKFSTKGNHYSFEVDGKPYTLNALTLDSLERVQEVMTAEPAKQGELIIDFIGSQTDKRTMDVIRKLPIPNIGELFQDWAGIVQPGVTPGESEGSPES
jgi:hypothetical protein